MRFTVNDTPRRFLPKPALILAVCGAAGLCFAAAAQQQDPQGPGETPPAIGADELTPGEATGEPDEMNATEVRDALGELEAELDAGVPPAEIDQVPAAATNAVVQHVQHPQGLGLLRKARLSADGYTAKTAEGKLARLTLHPHLQQQMQKLLAMYKPVGAAVVALDPKTGKVLALAEYGEGRALRPLYPAASIFKIITGAALLEKGVDPDSENC